MESLQWLHSLTLMNAHDESFTGETLLTAATMRQENFMLFDVDVVVVRLDQMFVSWNRIMGEYGVDRWWSCWCLEVLEIRTLKMESSTFNRVYGQTGNVIHDSNTSNIKQPNSYISAVISSNRSSKLPTVPSVWAQLSSASESHTDTSRTSPWCGGNG